MYFLCCLKINRVKRNFGNLKELISYIKKKDNYDRLPLVLFLFLILVLIRKGLFYNNFNLDEVILYFTAKGIQVHEIFEGRISSNGLLETWLVNRRGGSLDPGLFTYLLHFWSFLSNHTLWLRLLPMSFFFLSIIIFSKSLANLKETKFIPFLVISLFFLDPLFINYAFTVRPYMMEICGVFYLFYLMSLEQATLDKPKWSMALILLFFLGSRYTFWFSYTLYFIFTYFYLETKLQKKNFILINLIPVAYILITLFFTMRFQLSDLNFHYTDQLYLSIGGWDALKSTFSHPLFLCLVSYPTYLHFTKKNEQRTIQHKKISFFILASFSIYFILDLMKISPISFQERYSLGLHALSFISVTLFLLEILSDIDAKKQKRLSLFLGPLVLMQASTFTFQPQSDLVPVMKFISNTRKASDIIICDKVSYAMVVYLKDVARYAIDWDKMPQFKALELKEFEMKNFDQKPYFFTVSGFSGTDEWHKMISNLEDYKQLAGTHFQKFYGFKE